MPSQSLAELHEQGRYNYGYWPLWLALKHQQVAQLLLQTQPEIQLLRVLALPLPDAIPTFTTPKALTPAGTAYLFERQVDENLAVMNCTRRSDSGQRETCDLLHVAAADDWYIQHAVAQFNLALQAKPIELVFNAACLWVSLHGQGWPAVQWVADKAPVVATGWD